jgi:excinuclease ABC subunit A
LEVLHRLADQGNTVVVIEHNLDVIKTADWVIDLGPGGGVNGGRIVVEGTPETVAATAESFTGQYLKPLLERASIKPVIVDAAPKRPKRTRKVTADEPDLIPAK